MDAKIKNSSVRRDGYDRRKIYTLEYFLKGGVERRKWKDRRREEKKPCPEDDKKNDCFLPE